MNLDQIKDLILKLENKLLLSEVRGSAQRLGEILSPGFFEFGSSGTVYQFNEGDTFPGFPPHIRVEIKDFCITPLAQSCVLATYTCLKHNEQSGEIGRSLRSSVWRDTNGVWKIIFHQGTPCA